MGQRPDISIVTVNYNGLRDTIELIESLKTLIMSVVYEIVVVDNGSRKDPTQVLRERFPDVKMVRSERNLGFSGGNNLGFREAAGRYVFLLNNDTIVKEDCFACLLKAMEDHPEAGALSPKIRFTWDDCPVQFAGFTPLSTITLRNRSIGWGESDRGQYDTPAVTPYAHGAAMLVRSEVITQTGGMPELFFLYYEELDWSMQITRLGWSIRYEPCQTIYHKESQSTGSTSPLKTFYITRNRMLFAWRNIPCVKKYISIIYQMFVVVPKDCIFALVKGRSDLAGAVLRGMAAFVAMKGKKAGRAK